MADEITPPTSVWDRIKASLGLQYGMPFIDGPDEPETQLDLFPPEHPIPPFLDLSTATFGYDPGFDLGPFAYPHELPQARLEELVRDGKIMSVTTFDEHMHPDVHWIAPAEFGAAFDELTRAEEPMPKEVAYTELQPIYPGFVNIQPLPPEPSKSDPFSQRDEFDTIQLLVRGSPRTVGATPAPIGGGLGGAGGMNEHTIAGDVVKINMPVEAWDALVLQVNRWRAGEPQEVTEPTGFNIDDSANDAEADRMFGKPETLVSFTESDIGQANHDCLAKRRPGEPMFILLGRDPDAGNVVRFWADRRYQAGGEYDHCMQAIGVAEELDRYAADPANAPASAPAKEKYPAPSRRAF